MPDQGGRDTTLAGAEVPDSRPKLRDAERTAWACVTGAGSAGRGDWSWGST